MWALGEGRGMQQARCVSWRSGLEVVMALEKKGVEPAYEGKRLATLIMEIILTPLIDDLKNK